MEWKLNALVPICALTLNRFCLCYLKGAVYICVGGGVVKKG